jgi:hypothetical protein
MTLGGVRQSVARNDEHQDEFPYERLTDWLGIVERGGYGLTDWSQTTTSPSRFATKLTPPS